MNRMKNIVLTTALMKTLLQAFDPDSGTTVTTDMEPAVSIDHAERLVTGIQSLMTVLGITEMTPMAVGTLVKFYKFSKKGDTAAQVGEGEEIGLTEYERKLVKTWELGLEKYRKRSTAELIQKIGRDKAVNKTDDLLEREIQKGIKSKFYTFLADGEGSMSATCSTLQACLAELWGALQTYEPFIDGDFNPVYFVNPQDIAYYLRTAQISLQTAFGFKYVEDFLGLGMVVVDPSVPAAHPIATVKENLNGVYIPTGGDIGSTFGLTSDVTGMVGIKHFLVDGKASIDTLMMSGVLFYAEDLGGVFSGEVTGNVQLRVDKTKVTVAASATATVTATTDPAGETVTWASADTSVATVAAGVITGVAAGKTTVTAKCGDKVCKVAVTVTAS